MVWNDDFIWGHIPRTGGDITSMMFERAACHVDPIGDFLKHRSFEEAGFERPVRVLNIRRLPSFLMSWCVMLSGRLRECDTSCFNGGVYLPSQKCFKSMPVVTKANLTGDKPYTDEFAREYGPIHLLPDMYMRKFEHLKVNHWIRLESLTSDFQRIVGVLGLPVSDFGIPKNTTKAIFPYNHDIGEFFNDEELNRIYRNNPRWASMETQVYVD